MDTKEFQAATGIRYFEQVKRLRIKEIIRPQKDEVTGKWFFNDWDVQQALNYLGETKMSELNPDQLAFEEKFKNRFNKQILPALQRIPPLEERVKELSRRVYDLESLVDVMTRQQKKFGEALAALQNSKEITTTKTEPTEDSGEIIDVDEMENLFEAAAPSPNPPGTTPELYTNGEFDLDKAKKLCLQLTDEDMIYYEKALNKSQPETKEPVEEAEEDGEIEQSEVVW